MTRTGDAVTILPQPDFTATFPGPFPTSPHGERTERQLLGWLEEYPLLPSARARSVLVNITSHGVSRTLPTADADDLVLFAELLLWLTAFDDMHGESNAARDLVALVDRTAELTLVLAGGSPPPLTNPFPAALYDLLARFRARTGPAAYLRLAASLRDTIMALVWEAHHVAEPERVALETYLEMRPHTVFVRTIFAAAEIVLDYELTDAQRALAPVRHLETAVANLAGWINDLASYEREAARGPAQPLSLPTLLRARHGGSLEEAFARAGGMCENEAAVARQGITSLAGDPPSALTAHARALEDIARSFVWHTSHARYQGPKRGAAPTSR
ncbi:terpene synthase family protein [Streptomyces cyslabdanicus]|uniref:(12E)-labda-8(17),12,14-triene synthase n=1 Tax=Streptomyces cyslabdanicus TaxID=1470456 RepID=CLDD_STRCP|nr:RecName: Full=(12E)-labda-8(17),12,14-triene synthase; AltName: Full=Type-A diterpene synthase [Streptomyces cyslabdanicus]BAR97453.1 labdatriene synthase [Streptomyces cyslabdanicus]